MSIELEIKEVQTSLKAVNDDLKRFADESQKQIKTHSSLSEEVKTSVDKLLVTQGELQARLHAAEQLIVSMDGKGKGDAAPMTMGQTVITSDAFVNFSGHGRFSVPVKSAIVSDITNGNHVQPQRLGMVAGTMQRLFIRDLLTAGRTASNSLEFVRETGFTNNADVVSENPTNAKPESQITFELDSVPVATIAHWIKASKQVLADAPMLASYIDGRLRYGLKLKEEAQLLNGSGVGLNITGLMTAATAYSNPGVNPVGETAIDRLRLAMLQVTLAEYDADGIVLSPIDWTAIELTKTTDQAYLFTSPTGMQTPILWGRPVVASQSLTAGDFLVGAFGQAAQLWDREDARVTISTEDNDNFTKNMVTMLCEERVGLTIFRPEALVAGDFSGLPSSI